MGDQLVLDICRLLASAAKANGISESQLGTIVGIIVNALRDRGYSDDEIIVMLAEVGHG